MLTSKDLMIGDWVNLSKGNWSEKRQVELIDIEMIAESVYLAEPIPLTPEILEKNGFKKCDGCNQWTLYKPHFYCILCDIDKPYLEIASYNGDIGEFNRSGIRFIHELQHALRLCGIEKEIEL